VEGYRWLERWQVRILIIGPSSNLASNIEIDSIAPAHECDIVSDNVTQVRLMNRVARQSYDILHFLAHGDDGGIRLSDGVMAPEDMARLAKHTKARMVFLNACSSTVPGQYLVDVGIPSVIVHNREVPDDEAIQVAGYFYNELAVNGGDMKSAYSVANPRDGTFSWLSNGNYRDPLLQEITALRQEGNQRNRALQWLSAGVIAHMATAAGLWFYQAFYFWR